MRSTNVKCALCAVLQAIGYAVMLWAIFRDGAVSGADLRSLGAALVLGSLLWFLITRKRTDESSIYEMGRQAGYEAGWRDARRAGSLTLVDRREPTDEKLAGRN